MASFYRTLTYTTGSVSAGATLTRSDSIASNVAEIVKVKVAPSNITSTELTSFTITKHNTWLDADAIYMALNFIGNLIDPIEYDGVVYTERNEGYVCRYTDLDNAKELNVKIVNNGTLAKTYTVTVTYLISEDSRGYINVKDYGAIGNGSANDTTAIQAAMNACAALYSTAAGTVWIPPGTYLVDALAFPVGVCLKGAGQYATVLKSNSAVTMLALSNTAPAEVYVEDMTLWGNNVGTKGIEFTSNANTFILSRLQIQNFTTCGIHIGDALVFGVRDCFIFNDIIGILIDSLHNNSIYFEGCQIKGNTTYGVKVTGGNAIALRSCDIEANGTAADNSTGGVYAVGLNGDGVGIGLIIEDCWFESNYGHAEIEIGQPSNGNFMDTTVRNTTISGANAPYGFYASGSKTTYNIVDCTIFNHTTNDLKDDGTVLCGRVSNSRYNGTNTAGVVDLFPSGDAAAYPALSNAPNYFARALNVVGNVLVQSITGVLGSTNATAVYVNAVGGTGNSQIVATHIGAGTTKPLEIFSDAVLCAKFGVNGGNGQTLLNLASTDFSSAIVGILGTTAIVTATTNAQVLAFSASGGDGNTQIVTTHSGAGTTKPLEIFYDSTLIMAFGVSGTDIKWGKPLVALGGGAVPVVGTIGGSGPATAAQNSWLRVLDSTGAACWVPVWK